MKIKDIVPGKVEFQGFIENLRDKKKYAICRHQRPIGQDSNHSSEI